MASTINQGAYKEVRGLTRGLALLKALNAAPGGIATTTELGQACNIHRTTVKRLVETLRTAGLVRLGERDGQYCLTFEVRRLSEGFVDEAIEILSKNDALAARLPYLKEALTWRLERMIDIAEWS